MFLGDYDGRDTANHNDSRNFQYILTNFLVNKYCGHEMFPKEKIMRL